MATDPMKHRFFSLVLIVFAHVVDATAGLAAERQEFPAGNQAGASAGGWPGVIWGALFLLLAVWAFRLRRAGRNQARAAADLAAAHETARASEQRWKLLFEQSPLSVQIFEPDGQTMLFNDAWRRLFRLSDEQGLAFNVLKAPDLIESGAVNLIRKAFEGEVVQVPPVPFTVNTDPPEVRWIGGLVYPLKNEAGEILEVVVIHHDITEMKRAEQAMQEINDTLEKKVAERTGELQVARMDLERALAHERELGELKSRFVTMVSHEFRTPLGIIMSAVELLRHYSDRLPVEEKERLLLEIHTSTKHMGDLMEQVLLLGRAEAGKVACNPRPLDLAKVAERVVAQTEASSGGKCPIVIAVEGDVGDVGLDEVLLRHILFNLLGNAVKYSPGDSEVKLRLLRRGSAVVIEVIDRGIGIPEKDLPHLFETFHRCSNVGDIPGTGLGLVIVKRCAELHGGSVRVESRPGQGTTFTVELPPAR
jgi:PAS domain S-box-containing protein